MLFRCRAWLWWSCESLLSRNYGFNFFLTEISIQSKQFNYSLKLKDRKFLRMIIMMISECYGKEKVPFCRDRSANRLKRTKKSSHVLLYCMWSSSKWRSQLTNHFQFQSWFVYTKAYHAGFLSCMWVEMMWGWFVFVFFFFVVGWTSLGIVIETWYHLYWNFHSTNSGSLFW